MKDYKDYKNYMLNMAYLGSAGSILHWDQEVNLPPRGAGLRAQQGAAIQAIVHEKATNPELERLVNNLLEQDDLSFKQRRNLEETKKDLDKVKKLNGDFVHEFSMAVSQAFQSWHNAKQANDFKQYLPALEALVELSKQKADMLGYEDSPYNAMLDGYEDGLTCSTLEKVFGQVKKQIVPLVSKIAEAPQVNDSFLYKSYAEDKQWDFSLNLLKVIGFDFEAGRQDKSAHPFTMGCSPDDVRLTTRIKENDLAEVIWSTIHEGGHGLYEQGLSSDEFGLPCGSFLSLGIHESQSRIWENNVGRALPFWEYMFPQLSELFPDQLRGVSAIDFYKAMNKVQPSLIRTSADELTYHLHVMIRYEIEKSLFEGEVQVNELEELWNSKYQTYLGVSADKSSDGVLQDVHWSHGSFGYFPTYSLGSFYAAQFYAQAKSDLAGLEDELKNGDCSSFLKWSREKVHTHGKAYSADDLCKNITGETLNIDHFIRYAKDKYSKIYDLNLD